MERIVKTMEHTISMPKTQHYIDIEVNTHNNSKLHHVIRVNKQVIVEGAVLTGESRNRTYIHRR